MLVFNLKKEWFEKIKNGEKTHEFRIVKLYWTNRIRKSLYGEYITNNAYFDAMCSGGNKFVKPLNPECYFRCGYPKNGQNIKELKANIKNITIKHGLRTDLEYNGAVYDIEFELIED